MRRLFFVMLAAFALVSCSKEGGDEPKNIEVTGGSTEQEVYADNTQGQEGVRFTTTGPWTSSIASVTRADSPTWVSISPASGDKAGDYTINIKLEPNYTGQARKAEIKINSGGTTITITVAQEGTTQGGEQPKPQKLVRKILVMPGSGEDASNTSFTYHADGRVKTIAWDYGRDGASTSTFSYADNTITEDNVETGVNSQMVYTLNSDGWIGRYAETNYGERGTFTYNNGYLTDVAYMNRDREKYVWEGENLKTYQLFYSGTGAESAGTLYTYVYGTELNNCSANVDIFKVLLEGPHFWSLDYFGKRTKNLPTKQIGSQDKWDKENGTYTYRYEKDTDGYITKIYAIYQSDGEEADPEFLYYEIQYQ